MTAEPEAPAAERSLRLRRVLDVVWPGHPRRWRDVPRRLAPTALQTARLTLATVLGYVLTVLLTGATNDLTGALTALLVVQATSFSSLRMGVVRVLAVLSGVLLAVLVSNYAGLSWWSLALVVATAVIVAKVLHLGDQSLEVAISAMLILGVKRHETAAEARIVATVIGSVVGVGFGLLFAPRHPERGAAGDLRRASGLTTGLLRKAADSLRTTPVTDEAVRSWLEDCRAIARQLQTAAGHTAELRDARRFNPHALTTANAEPLLRVALDTVTAVQLAIQAMFSTMLREAPVEPTVHDGYGDEVRLAFAVVLDTMADAVSSFQEGTDAELDGRLDDVPVSLDGQVDNLRETRAILTELMLVNARADQSLWLLRGSVLAAVEEVLRQLDVRAREQRRSEQGLAPVEG